MAGSVITRTPRSGDTGRHPLYLSIVPGDGVNGDRRAARRLALLRPLAGVIGDQLQDLPPETRAIVEMLAVLNARAPLAQLGRAAGAGSPSAAVEPAVAGGLVDWSPEEPSCPVVISGQAVRDAIYAGITPTRRRVLHARAAEVVGQAASWEHRVAALEQPDEGLAAELERLAAGEAAAGRLALAATRLRWASDISPARADRERRLLTAAMHLVLAGESRGLALRPAVEETAPSPLRSCVLGTMAFSAGRLAEAERLFSQALGEARNAEGSQPLAALIATRLAGTYELLGDGEKAIAFGRLALGAGCLDAAAASQARTLLAIGAMEAAGPRAALVELAHLDADPARVGPADVDALTSRGVFRLLGGDLEEAIGDLSASIRLAHRAATVVMGLRAYVYLTLALYLAGKWDDALLTTGQGFSAAAIQTRHHELPLVHLAAGCVPASRGAAGEAERHAALAEQAAADLDYGQEKVYAAMARALVCQAAGDYLGMADALGPWQDDPALDGRSRACAVLWRPLLAEGLIGSGQLDRAAAVLGHLRAAAQVGFLTPALAWLEGWLAEQRGDLSQALQIYARGEQAAGTGSPVYAARLLLAHGRLLRRTGSRKDAVERLRRASDIYTVLRAAPFIARTEEELAACRLPASPAAKQSALALTSRETEVAHLIGKGLSNQEIAAELYISRKAVEYHLGNIYAKLGLQGRRELRGFVGQKNNAAISALPPSPQHRDETPAQPGERKAYYAIETDNYRSGILPLPFGMADSGAIPFRYAVADIVTGALVLAVVTSLPNAVTAVYLARRAAVPSMALNSNAINVTACLAAPVAAARWSIGCVRGLSSLRDRGCQRQPRLPAREVLGDNARRRARGSVARCRV